MSKLYTEVVKELSRKALNKEKISKIEVKEGDYIYLPNQVLKLEDIITKRYKGLHDRKINISQSNIRCIRPSNDAEQTIETKADYIQAISEFIIDIVISKKEGYIVDIINEVVVFDGKKYTRVLICADVLETKYTIYTQVYLIREEDYEFIRGLMLDVEEYVEEYIKKEGM